jgi:hypothetical protein
MISLPFGFDWKLLEKICDGYPQPGFELVDEDTHHDDGVVYSYVVKHIETDRYFQIHVSYDSWEGHHWEYVEIDDLVEVRPQQVMVTQYVPIPLENTPTEIPYTLPVIECPKCGAKGAVFICDTPGCPVNGGAAHG